MGVSKTKPVVADTRRYFLMTDDECVVLVYAQGRVHADRYARMFGLTMLTSSEAELCALVLRGAQAIDAAVEIQKRRDHEWEHNVRGFMQ